MKEFEDRETVGCTLKVRDTMILKAQETHLVVPSTKKDGKEAGSGLGESIKTGRGLCDIEKHSGTLYLSAALL